MKERMSDNADIDEALEIDGPSAGSLNSSYSFSPAVSDAEKKHAHSLESAGRASMNARAAAAESHSTGT